MKIDITHIAKLANLPLNNDEKQKFEKQLEETLSYVEKLNQINTKNVPPTDHVTGLENITQEDITIPSLSQKEALQNTKSKYNELFKVKSILVNS